jgi:phosphatidate cytidylyltransferase
MLVTRLLVGALLVALIVAMLVLDQPPWFPFLFLLLLILSVTSCVELMQLVPATRKLPAWLCYPAVVLLLMANWLAHVPGPTASTHPWLWVLGTFGIIVLAAFLVEMATFQEPGDSVNRIALTVWIVGYLGVLPSFFIQLRWLGGPGGLGEPGSSSLGSVADVGTVALALAVFVPKTCDIGAFFTGRFLGRHRMTPILSPKKTWEGAIGGLVVAVLVTVGIDRLGPAPVLRENILLELGFGITVGVFAMWGDLAESLIKRDCRQKDASQVVPGFGGVLDVVDSVIFAAPVAYIWLRSSCESV